HTLFFSRRRRHTSFSRDWSSDVCSSDLASLRLTDLITTIDHLGIAVRSLDEAVPYYEKTLGLVCEHREEVPSQKVRTAFFSVGDDRKSDVEGNGVSVVAV